MENQTISIFKTKKTMVFVLLFLILLTIHFFVKIEIVQADTEPSTNLNFDNSCATAKGQKQAMEQLNTPGPQFSYVDTLGFAKAIGFGILMILMLISASILKFCNLLFSLTLSTIMSWTITKSPLFIPGWIMVKDLSNMLIVLGFVIIGIATTLRIQDYQAKKLLLPLILIALLINFSNVFVGLIIDGSNLTMSGFSASQLDPSSGPSSGSSGFKSSSIGSFYRSTLGCVYAKTVGGPIGLNLLKNNYGLWIGYSAILTFFDIAVALVLLYISLLLIARYIILGMLFILSPLAFVFWVFPKTKSIWNQWWEQFLKWSFVGVIINFFLWLGIIVLTSGQLNDNLVLNFTVSLMFLFIGVKISAKSSGVASMAAGAVMGLAGGAAGLAMGVAGKAGVGTLKGIGKEADALSGGRLSSAGQKISGATGRFMEKFTGKTGATAMKEAARVAAEQKGMDAALASGNVADMARVQQLARTGRGVKGAAAMAAVASAGKIGETFKDSSGKLDMTSAGQRLTYASQFGAGNLMEKAAKEDSRFAQFNTPEVNKFIKQGMAEPVAKQEAINQSVAKKSRPDIEKMSPEALDESSFIGMNPQQLGWIMERGSPALQEKARKFSTPGSKEFIDAGAHVSGLDRRHFDKWQDNAAYMQSRGNLVPPPPPNQTPPPSPTPPSTGPTPAQQAYYNRYGRWGP